ncbi:HAD family phosphatase [Bacillus sp. BGMRC 2118]|nr:HAD family phosphatase [Bacillus sp. BGMRC 2118]
MKPHIIAIDLDGTLLTDSKVISSRTKRTLQTAMEAGHHVVIATGRPYRASKGYYQELGLTSPMVNFNGALVHHPSSPSWGIHHSPFDIQTAKEIIHSTESFSVKNILAEVMDDVYLHYHDENIMNWVGMGNPKVQTGNLKEILQHDPTSILIHAEESMLTDIRTHLSEIHAEVIDHRKWGAPFNVIEIVKSGMNKAIGLKRISEHFQVPQDRIIAFGDEDNDFEMIEYAGHGVAMGNAISELKTISNFVTKTNEEDGIAHYLEEVLQLKV